MQPDKRAPDVSQRARGGEDFAKLAVAYSNAPDRPGRGRARLAQRERAADLPHRRGHEAQAG